MSKKTHSPFTEDFMGALTSMIDGLFTNALSDKEETMQPQEVCETEILTPVYESIEDYTEQTGKRFRMTKDQKTRNLTREEAFAETFGGQN